MKSPTLSVDLALLDAWQGWLAVTMKRFGASGFADTARTISLAQLETAITSSDDLLFARALEHPEHGRGLIIAVHSRWEESVLHKPVAKVVFFAADSFGAAVPLAADAMHAAANVGVVLFSATPGHSPTFIHLALAEAGFHVGSQSLTVCADLTAIAPAVAKIPLRGTFRSTTERDADAVAAIAQAGFLNARFTSDPYFPAEWGGMLYAAWARNLVMGAADIVVVAERNGRVIGFVSMCMDDVRRARVPDLMAVDPKYDGFGVGVMLVRHMLDWYRERGKRYMIGGTEKNNTAINALYARLGVTFLDGNVVYHASPALSPLRERLA